MARLMLVRARDNQKSKLYNWEREHLFNLPTNSSLSLSACEKIVQRICASKGILAPKIKDGRGRRKACGCAGYISLPRWSRKKVVLLHELSHSILDDGKNAWHGPEFVRLFIELLSAHRIAPKRWLLIWAKNLGLKYAD